jgi:Sulfotransferase family
MQRSASTWSYNAVMRLLQLCFPADHVHGGYDEKIVHFLKSAPPTANQLVVKSHSLTAVAKTLARTGAAKVVYTWRDPADAIVSCMRLTGIDFEFALELIRESLALRTFHVQTGNAVIVPYEKVLHNPEEAIAGIGSYLGLSGLSASIIKEVAETFSFERMRDKTNEMDKMKESDLIERYAMRQDPQTLLFRNHIDYGGMGYGRTMLSPEQLKLVDGLPTSNSQ